VTTGGGGGRAGGCDNRFQPGETPTRDPRAVHVVPGPVFLEGDGITLRPAADEDRAFLRRNLNDPRVRAGRTDVVPTGEDDVDLYLGGTIGEHSVGLLACADERPVGYVLVNREHMGDTEYDRGELAYWIAPDEQGEGYATEASRVLLSHCFDRMGLHKVVARAFESNRGSQRVIEKLGFEREGTFRDEVFLGGEWEDYYRYGLLESEWRDGGV
jgi:RimJ/RimL family protein N-acetyltransferase